MSGLRISRAQIAQQLLGSIYSSRARRFQPRKVADVSDTLGFEQQKNPGRRQYP